MRISDAKKIFSHLFTGYLLFCLLIGSTNDAQAQALGLRATLLANNQANLAVNAGNTVSFTWSSSEGTSYSSYYTVNTADGCGNVPGHQYSYNQYIKGSNGTYVATITPCQTGYTYTYTYVVTNSSGRVQSSVVLTVVPSSTGALNVLDYGAKCDGSTDDTAAIQSVIGQIRSTTNNASSNGATIVIPTTGHGCVVSQLDMTNLQSKIRLIGEASMHGGQSYLLCKESAADSGVCVDLSGTDSFNVENLQIIGGTSTSNAPRVVVLMGKAYDSGGNLHNGSEITWNSVTITASNGSDYAVYNLGGETWNCYQCYITANGIAGVVLSSNNSASVSSPFVTLKSPPVSMTAVHFTGASFGTTSTNTNAVLLDPTPSQDIMLDIGFSDSYAHINGPAFVTDIGSGGIIQGLRFTGVRVEGYGPASTFAIFNNVVEQITVDAGFSTAQNQNQPTPLQFNNASYGPYSVIAADIKLRPGDGIGNYPQYVVNCAKNPNGVGPIGVVIHAFEAYGGGPTQSTCTGPGVTTIWNGN